MIDWLTLLVPFNGPEIGDGRCLQIDGNGEILSESLRYLPVEGSYSTKVIVCTESKGFLKISGNPSKFLQGHNLFGSDDLLGLSCAYVSKVLNLIGCLDLQTLSAVRNGDFWIYRVDLTYSYDLKDRSEVRSWLKAAKIFASGKNQKVDSRGSTIYIGRSSKRVSIKAYCKADELEKRPLNPVHFSYGQLKRLQDWAENKLRIEVTMRSKALRDFIIHDKLDPEYQRMIAVHGRDSLKNSVIRHYEEKASLFYAANWKCVSIPEIYTMKIMKMNVPGNLEIPHKEIDSLPNRFKAHYKIWKEGGNVSDYCSRATYFRVKSYFLNEHGINIDIQPNPKKAQVIPLLRPIEAKPAEVPDWAYNEGLIVCK